MVSFIKGAKKAKDFPASESEVVFVGRSNVGKSTIINALYKNGLAYVGKTPGKTRMLNFFDIDGSYTICDAPGYGYAKRNDREIIEFGDMMEDYFNKRKCLKLCVLIFDIRRDLNDDDLDMIEYLKQKDVPYLLVFNKIDKFSNNQLFNQKRILFKDGYIKEEECCFVSGEKKKNIELLKETILSYL